MKRVMCGVALLGAVMTLASCAATQGLLASGSGMFLKLGPATVGLGNNQQNWLALNSLNWAGGQYPQQGYPVATYPQQAYGYPQQAYGYPQQAYPQQAYPQQTYPQQTYDESAGQYPQQTYDESAGQYPQTAGTTGTAETYPQQTYDESAGQYPQQAYDESAGQYPQTADATGAVPSGPGLASLSTNDPAAAEALAQACASGQQVGTVTVRQVQPDGTYKDIQLDGVNLACGSPAAGGEPGEPLQPGDEVLMTFGDAKVVNQGKLKTGDQR